ncbi:MAG: tripartite tricarboxylate transporter substrate binding protein [Acetobacteraceae bacterium]|jgi:tripartite-type tricarboxylate transporter receptor subunit TctC|nr:tripartite tricarboxylate transporter substrate binding protein [Acetobacteraceae bacterium]
MPSRRAVLAAALAAPLAAPARAQEAWPSRPVGVILPLQAGSASDAAARILLELMEAELGQRFVVENVLGAAGQIGAERAARARPDGYTLAALNNSILTILPVIRQGRVAFDPMGDFIPLSGIATIPTYLGVHPSVPARTVPELIAWARSRNGEVNYASGGAGSPQHLATEMFMAMAGVRMTHVPYRGATQAAADLAAGHVDVMFIAHTLALPFLDGNRVRLIAYAGPRRSKAMPDIPTVAEQGVAGYDYSSWIALFAPKGTPEPIVARLRASAQKALAAPGVEDRLARAGNEIWPLDHAALAATMAADTARWREVVRTAEIKAD